MMFRRIPRAQNIVVDTIQEILKTGRVKESGVLIDDRKIFFAIEADSAVVARAGISVRYYGLGLGG
jgi:hypothetical protein